MKVRITPSIQSEMEGAIEDALRAKAAGDASDASNAVYLKIHDAMQSVAGVKVVVIDADDRDLAELRSRADNEVGPCGVCTENIADSYEFADRAYWLGRQRAYRALLKQIAQGR